MPASAARRSPSAIYAGGQRLRREWPLVLFDNQVQAPSQLGLAIHKRPKIPRDHQPSKVATVAIEEISNSPRHQVLPFCYVICNNRMDKEPCVSRV